MKTTPLADMEKRVHDTQNAIERLEATCTARVAEIDKLEEERCALAIKLVAEQDKKAEAREKEVSSAIADALRQNLQDQRILARLKGALETARAARQSALDFEERRFRYGQVLALIRPRLEGKLENRLLELTDEIRRVALELSDSDSKISSALCALGPQFLREAAEFPYRERSRQNAVLVRLKDIAAIPMGDCFSGDPTGAAVRAFSKLAETLREAIGELKEVRP